MSEVTHLLLKVARGDRSSEPELYKLVYDSLRRLAGYQMRRERRNHTLQPTALVNEVYLRLVGEANLNWESRAHFYNAAARMMRRILVDHARAAQAAKRAGARRQVDLEDNTLSVDTNPDELLAIEQALARLEEIDPRAGRVVELRFFGGLSVEEAAQVLTVSPKTVKRDWEFARVFFESQLGDGTAPAQS